MKPGTIETKKCARCKELFFPSHGSQKLCPYCQGRPYGGKGRPPKSVRCQEFGCPNKHFAKGYCEKHYKYFIKNKADEIKRKLKKAEKWHKEGTLMCEFFRGCQVYFTPKARNQFGLQKICPNCAKLRSYKTTREKTGRPKK